MGLDLFAHGVDPKKFESLPPILCGSMFTNGQSSIRGKVYAGFIEHICGVDIYQEKLPNKDLDRIISQLSLYCVGADELFNGEYTYREHETWCMDFEEAQALLNWFKIVKENNGMVIGWW